jgi:hypothetical protein
MRKKTTKLTLARETLRNLNGPALRWVAGGTHQQTNCSDCGNDTTQTSGNCGSGFCGTASCDFCAIETSAGLNACICESVKAC